MRLFSILLLIIFFLSCFQGETPQNEFEIIEEKELVKNENNPRVDQANPVPEMIDKIEEYEEEYVFCDLDKDNINDTLFISSEDASIVCKLSSENFKEIKSPAGIAEFNPILTCTKSGFEFSENHMRAGYASQFRYDKALGIIQLIGMSRYEFGPANNDGSGESSVNLLTNKYIGDWNHYDEEKEKLIKMPMIKVGMFIDKISLKEYDGSSMGRFQDQCYELYKEAKEKM